MSLGTSLSSEGIFYLLTCGRRSLVSGTQNDIVGRGHRGDAEGGRGRVYRGDAEGGQREGGMLQAICRRGHNQQLQQVQCRTEDSFFVPRAVNPFTTVLVAPSLENRPKEVPNLKTLRLFSLFA